MSDVITNQNEANSSLKNRSIRVFVSSTFRDMVEDRNALMAHTWPQLRQFCRERHVELVEVDLRWGIAEEQSTRKETLKLCLDEIRACRPFFAGLLGERYGWVPGDDAFTKDLQEEQPWLRVLKGKSVTELEILHGVLNNPEMAGQAFFYFRDPEYAGKRGTDFLSENDEAAKKQIALKEHIRATCAAKNIPLHENYTDPDALAGLVLEQLKAAIEAQFPKAEIPNPLDREASDHEAFAEIRRRTYIGRPDYFEALDSHAAGQGAPLVILGDSGSGKSALLANWIDLWRKAHPKDFVFQHYIGGTSDSAVHWKLMTRLMAEIKRWTEDPDELPRTNDDILRDFPLWLTKARIRAEREGVRFIIVLDALNQLEDKDHGKLLGWLPEHPFTGALRLIVSTLPGVSLDALEKRAWQTLRIQPLTTAERQRMIVRYLKRFSKELDEPRLVRITDSTASSNPLYLKILLDELRVTGRHERLDEILNDYLLAKDIPTLLGKVLARYQRDYEHDRKNLVGDALGLIWAARRGLTEAELLQLLKPANLTQLPLATWAPLRAALEEGLVDQGGILNFAHDFLLQAVETAFLPNLVKKDDYRIILADYFEAQPITARSSDELPWLLKQAKLFDRLRHFLLDIDSFLEIQTRDKYELLSYWVYLNEETTMGKAYLDSFDVWIKQLEVGSNKERISSGANQLGLFLLNASVYNAAELLIKRALKVWEEGNNQDQSQVAVGLSNLAQLFVITNRPNDAEPLLRKVLKINEDSLGEDHPKVARCLNNLAYLLYSTNRFDEAERIMRSSLKIEENNYGLNHPNTTQCLNNLAQLLQDTNRLDEAENIMNRVLIILQDHYGQDHPKVGICLSNLGTLLKDTNRIKEAEPLLRKALKIHKDSYGQNHPSVATDMNNLALLLQDTDYLDEAESLMRRALKIEESCYGRDHPKVAISLSNLSLLLRATNRFDEAEPLMRKALKIDEDNYGPNHLKVATDFNNLSLLLQDTNRLDEAELLIRKALLINERSLAKDHPEVARNLHVLATLFYATNRLSEAELIMQRVIRIFNGLSRATGYSQKEMALALNNYGNILNAKGLSRGQIIAELEKIAPEFFKG